MQTPTTMSSWQTCGEFGALNAVRSQIERYRQSLAASVGATGNTRASQSNEEGTVLASQPSRTDADSGGVEWQNSN
jgi:hypothetical protein